jgi:chromosomal replication initiator protein
MAVKTASELWGDFLAAAATKLSGHVVDSWLKPLRCASYENATVVIEVRDQFARDWLRDHYVDFIRDELSTVAGESVAVDWIVNPELSVKDAKAERLRDAEDEIAREAEPQRSGVSETVDADQRHSRQLNPRYNFETFVAGPSNQFAFAACKAVAENPAVSYNPLFLFGGVGLGKTHLLSAIGHQILKDKPRARIVYTSSEAFVNEVINAVRFSKLDEFHAKYRRNCDVFLVDDIQLIAGKERTQHEFFHIFNTLYDSQRQIVVTSDKLPHEIPEIEERLRNRFQWGLIADVQPPEIETRVAILRKKADSERTFIEDEVIFFLAKNIRSNVRELEGALVRLMAHASLTGKPLTIDYAQTVLADILQSRSLALSVESIQKLVCSYYQVKIGDLKSSRRQRVLVRPRQVAMYLARKHAGASFPELGSRFGDKDHTTIMSACKKVDALLKTDAALRKEVHELERRLDVLNP